MRSVIPFAANIFMSPWVNSPFHGDMSRLQASTNDWLWHIASIYGGCRVHLDHCWINRSIGLCDLHVLWFHWFSFFAFHERCEKDNKTVLKYMVFGGDFHHNFIARNKIGILDPSDCPGWVLWSKNFSLYYLKPSFICYYIFMMSLWIGIRCCKQSCTELKMPTFSICYVYM